MAITSVNFLAFCILSVIIFVIFPPRYRWIPLLISSVAFYCLSLSDKKILIWIIVTSLTTWLAGRKLDSIARNTEMALQKTGLEKEEEKRIRAHASKKRKTILTVVLMLNIGILICFKLWNYYRKAFTIIIGALSGYGTVNMAALIMPLGISYYTFSTIGYILDVYWKRYESEKNFARYFLFAIYFPHILQGPISRYSKLGQELKKPKLYFSWDNFVTGMESICLGCFKKLVIANRAGIFVANTLTVENLHGSVYILALILDAIQIYTDFSGYMDIVAGISKIFDIELEPNFNHPFLAQNVPDFWRRWHMSLGSWFKDYVYYPITVSRGVKKLNKRVKNWKSPPLKKLMAVVIPVMVTWLLTGLWHGTGKGYVAWGIYWGILITASVTFSEDMHKVLSKLSVNTECFSYRLFQTIKIFCIFIGGRFIGSIMGLSMRLSIIKSICTSLIDFDFLSYGLNEIDFSIIFAGVALLTAIAAIETKENIFHWFNRQNKLFCAVVLYVVIYAFFLLGIYGTGYDTSTFMYQQF